MARIPYLDVDDLAEGDKDLLNRPIALARAMVNSPGMARAFGGLARHIRYGSPLDMRLRELAIIQVGYLARSDYEYSHHTKLGLDEFGVSQADIHAISAETDRGEGAGGLPPLDTAVLRAAREMVAGGAAAATVEELQRHLSHEELVDLILTIGFYCGVVRVLASLEIDVEPEYAPYLTRFPFPERKDGGL